MDASTKSTSTVRDYDKLQVELGSTGQPEAACPHIAV